MKVAELIEKLQAMPGHVQVMIELPADGSGGGAGVDFCFTLDAELSSFPSQGRMAVITLNSNPT